MRVLIVGLGGIGQRHTRNLRVLLGNDVEIIAYRVRRLTHVVTPALVVDPDRNVENEYQIRTFSDLGKALAQKPAVAFICNPSSLHVPVALACLEAQCDIFVEKPLSLDKTILVVANALRQRRLEAENRALRARVDRHYTMVGESAAIRQRPHWIEAHRNLAQAYSALGRHREAEAELAFIGGAQQDAATDSPPYLKSLYEGGLLTGKRLP